jgi:hypothetical protein
VQEGFPHRVVVGTLNNRSVDIIEYNGESHATGNEIKSPGELCKVR